MYLALQQNTQIEAGLNTNITNQESLITQQKTTLTAELNLANEQLQAIPQQLNEMDQIYSAISGYVAPRN